MRIYIPGELGRSCSSQLDRIALVGNPTLFPNQPRGVRWTPGIHELDAGIESPWEWLCQGELLVERENISMDSFRFITSPNAKYAMNTGPRWPNSDTTVWESIQDRTLSANQVDDDLIYFGCWSQLCIGIWSLDIVTNPFSRATEGLTELVVSLYCSVAIKRPRCFGTLTFLVAPPPLPRKGAVTVKNNKASKTPAEPKEETPFR